MAYNSIIPVADRPIPNRLTRAIPSYAISDPVATSVLRTIDHLPSQFGEIDLDELPVNRRIGVFRGGRNLMVIVT